MRTIHLIRLLGTSATVYATLLGSTYGQTTSSSASPNASTSTRDPATPNTSANDSGKLEEIVVTAQKRFERLHDVPIAASAFTQSDIDRLSLNGIDSLSRAVPSLSFTSSGFEPSI